MHHPLSTAVFAQLSQFASERRTTARSIQRTELLYRRQFLIGPRFVDGFPSWTRLTIGGAVLRNGASRPLDLPGLQCGVLHHPARLRARSRSLAARRRRDPEILAAGACRRAHCPRSRPARWAVGHRRGYAARNRRLQRRLRHAPSALHGRRGGTMVCGAARAPGGHGGPRRRRTAIGALGHCVNWILLARAADALSRRCTPDSQSQPRSPDRPGRAVLARRAMPAAPACRGGRGLLLGGPGASPRGPPGDSRSPRRSRPAGTRVSASPPPAPSRRT